MKVVFSKKNKIRLAIEAGILVVMIIVFFIVNKNIDKENEKKEIDGINYYIDRLLYNDETEEIIIKGWCIKEGIACPDEASRANFKVWLAKDGERNEMLEIPVTPYMRTDVTNGYGGGTTNYDYSGFFGSIKVDPSVKQNKYRLLFQYDANVEKYIYTIRYLENGEMKTEVTQWDYNYK